MPLSEPTPFDVLIVGGGPAGLSAATILARCRRRVLVCDAGHPRNEAARHAHGFLTREGIAPGELLRLAREELRQYPHVELRHTHVTSACRDGELFCIEQADGTRALGRRLVLATGVVDVLPELPGFRDCYGISIHHCPFCDGYEWRDQPLALYGQGDAVAGMALALLNWSPQVTLCSHGPLDCSLERKTCLTAQRVALREERILRLESSGGMLQRIVFEEGPPLECSALFFNTGQAQACPLASGLGCITDDAGAIETGHRSATNIPGLYVIGDATRSVQMVVVAAAEGAEAAVAIHQGLALEDLGLAPPTPAEPQR